MSPCYRSSTLIHHYGERGGSTRLENEMPEDWRTPDVEALFNAILTLESAEDTERFFRDLCTLNELRDMAQRWAVVQLLDSGLHYAEISRRTGASTATITRIASWLNHGEGGYRAMLDKLDAASRAGTTPYPIAGER
jgi:TrpR-related protein YerC/YecD